MKWLSVTPVMFGTTDTAWTFRVRCLVTQMSLGHVETVPVSSSARGGGMYGCRNYMYMYKSVCVILSLSLSLSLSPLPSPSPC